MTAPVFHEVRDGTLFWTLSFYIPFSRMVREGTIYNPARTLERVDRDTADPVTQRLRDAMEPLFNDIADRTRQGQVQDRLLVREERRSIEFLLPRSIRWMTEGRRYQVDLEQDVDRRRPAQTRCFWYLHSDGSLSWHVSFEVFYRAQLEAEMAQGRVSTLYFLSLLQKLSWPKECDLGGADGPALDTLLGLHVRERPDAELSDDPGDFWQCIERWFKADSAVITLVHGVDAVTRFDRLCPEDPCVEVPGVQTRDTRSLLFIQDEQFFRLIQPKTSAGALVHRRERVLDEQFEAYPQAVKRLSQIDGVHRLDRPFWQSLLEDDRQPSPDAPPTAPERVLYLFLAGFNQNIIDWANQDASEVLDSLDPIYPASEEQLQEGFFIRYANPRSLITYVSRSRTLEVGNDHILTCPYTFLIHVLALNNEYLTRQKESRTFRVIDEVRAILRPSHNSAAPAAANDLGAAENKINALRFDSFDLFDRHRYFNPFRYDTERNVFDDLERLRGTSRLEDIYKEGLAALEEDTRDVARQRAEAAQAEQQRGDRKIAALFGIVGVSGLGQLAFNIYDYADDHRDGRFTQADAVLWLSIAVTVGVVLALVRKWWRES